MAARVDLNEFTKAVNSLDGIVSSLNTQLKELTDAGSQLRSAITGDLRDIQTLYQSVDMAQQQVQNNMKQIQGVINLIKQEHEHYIKVLRPMD